MSKEIYEISKSNGEILGEAFFSMLIRVLVLMLCWNYLAPNLFSLPKVYENLGFWQVFCFYNIFYHLFRIPVLAVRDPLSHEYKLTHPTKVK